MTSQITGWRTSFVSLFEPGEGGRVPIDRVEVPRIQRDFAQGRMDPGVIEIRHAFLEAVLDALEGSGSLGLDFVFGRVHDGALVPLDGQQRLTTLFLLHSYLAARVGEHDDAAWRQFSYEVRPSARLFCRRLGGLRLDDTATRPSDWLKDREWYLYGWRHDPTIQSMLVMLDAIAAAIAARPSFDIQRAWQRLVDTTDPAVWFLVLPLDGLASDEEFYIKMNSRGKPLTAFENFKARFLDEIRWSPRANEFAQKVDGAWSDLMWPIHGGDNIVDDELYRWFDFVTEICEFQEGRPGGGRLVPRTRKVFGAQNPRRSEHLDFLMDSLDAWSTADAAREFFEALVSTVEPGRPGYVPGRVVLHGAATVDLFRRCAHSFTGEAGEQRSFSLQQSLYLYAALVHRREQTADFTRRFRILRNLAAASDDEIRRSAMPQLLADVEVVIRTGDVTLAKAFNLNQRRDEVAKADFLRQHPGLAESLFRLEDHRVLRGTLAAFDLDPEVWERRAVAFERALSERKHWGSLCAALLATGDYQRRVSNSGWQFGTASPDNEAVWRTLLTGTTRDDLADTRAVLPLFLEGFAEAGSPLDDYADAVTTEWLTDRQERRHLDWRYYLVAYPAMREGSHGTYHAVDGHLGYSLCMLRTKRLHGYYRDPVLLAAWRESGVGDAIEDPWFSGWPSKPRWMMLAKSQTGIRNVEEGFLIAPPEGADDVERLGSVASTILTPDPATGLMRFAIAQAEGVDEEDRVVAGAEMIRALVRAGL